MENIDICAEPLVLLNHKLHFWNGGVSNKIKLSYSWTVIGLFIPSLTFLVFYRGVLTDGTGLLFSLFITDTQSMILWIVYLYLVCIFTFEKFPTIRITWIYPCIKAFIFLQGWLDKMILFPEIIRTKFNL